MVISGGGGGIPVARSETGELVGVEGVIDKDLASAMLALSVGAPELVILTTEERVMLNYGTPEAEALHILSVREALRHLADGQFPPGSMGPKIEGACRFIAGGGSPRPDHRYPSARSGDRRRDRHLDHRLSRLHLI